MLKRKLTKVLENWLKSGHEKALLLTGAHQVGKADSIALLRQEKPSGAGLRLSRKRKNLYYRSQVRRCSYKHFAALATICTGTCYSKITDSRSDSRKLKCYPWRRSDLPGGWVHSAGSWRCRFSAFPCVRKIPRESER